MKEDFFFYQYPHFPPWPPQKTWAYLTQLFRNQILFFVFFFFFWMTVNVGQYRRGASLRDSSIPGRQAVGGDSSLQYWPASTSICVTKTIICSESSFFGTWSFCATLWPTILHFGSILPLKAYDNRMSLNKFQTEVLQPDLQGVRELQLFLSTETGSLKMKIRSPTSGWIFLTRYLICNFNTKSDVEHLQQYSKFGW